MAVVALASVAGVLAINPARPHDPVTAIPSSTQPTAECRAADVVHSATSAPPSARMADARTASRTRDDRRGAVPPDDPNNNGRFRRCRQR